MLERAKNKVDSLWECKQNLMHIKTNHHFACGTTHGFQLDGPLEQFIFDNILDPDLFELLEKLQQNYPKVITLKDMSFSFDLSTLAVDKTLFSEITKSLDEQALKMNAEKIDDDSHHSNSESDDDTPLPQVSTTPIYTGVLSTFSNFLMSNKKSKTVAHTPPPPPPAPQTLRWEDEQYNDQDENDGNLVAIAPFSQLEKAGTQFYIYYSQDFQDKHTQNPTVAIQIKNYNKMLSKRNHGNGIKELRCLSTHQLMGYYTSDKNKNADTRIILKAVTTGKDEKMKTVIVWDHF